MLRSLSTRAQRLVRTPRRRKLAALGVSLALIAAPLMLPSPASAAENTTLDGSPFNGSNGELDSHASIGAHNDVGTPDTLAGGVKEDTDCPDLDGGGAPDKSDLVTGYVGHATGTVGGQPHTYVYLGWLRSDVQGTATINFELNSGSTPCPGGSPFVKRTLGSDLLFTYDFQGGATVGVSVRTWTTGNGNKEEWSAPTVLDNTKAEASIRTDMKFGELVIDMTAANFFKQGECKTFPTAVMRSRASSASFENQLKDIILPFRVDISNCGRIDIEKIDDARAPLAGAVFTLHADHGDEPGSAVTPTKSCTTDAAGKCTITDINPGTYWVVETTTPPGHTGAAPRRVVVGSDNNNPPNPLAFTNQRKPATVKIVKKDDTGAALEGAKFRLYGDVNGERGPAISPEKSCVTDAAGLCSITGILPPGGYIVHEEEAPTGYSLAADQAVDLDLGETIELTFIDIRNPAKVNIVKKDDAGAALQGAKFRLYQDANGVRGSAVTPEKSCVTDPAGLCSISGILPPGKYWIHEDVVPTGYTAANDQSVDLALDETATLTFVNERKPATVKIVKKDDAGTLLSGATFGLFEDAGDHKGDPVSGKSCTTDAQGECLITGIVPGTYWLSETVVPAGHTAAADAEVTLGNDETLTVPFVNTRQPARVDIVKTDDAQAPLAGATFALYHDDDGKVGLPVSPAKACTTNAAGLCSITEILPPGTYWVHENVVPAWHSAAADQQVDLELGETVTLTFVDVRKPNGISIDKKVNGLDTSSEEPLEVEVGSTLEYEVVITNSGLVPLTVSDLTDTLKADLDEACVPPVVTQLDPGESITCSYTMTADDPGGDSIIHNTATVTGTDIFERGAGPDSDDTYVHVLNPAIHLEKTGPAQAHVGDTVTYTLTVTNAGNTPLLITGWDDPLCSADPVLVEKDGDDEWLDLDEEWVYECSHVVVAGDPDRLVNTATVTGADKLETEVDDTDDAATDILRPAIAITKTGPTSAHVGDAVVYALVVTNPGNTPLASVTVSDPKCDGPAVRATVDADGLLSPGESWTYHCTHVAAAADGASILNTARSEGTDPLGQTVDSTDDHTAVLLHPAISIVKTASPESISVAGSVTYTYVVTNTGDTTLFDVQVTDDILGPIGSVGRLEPGESVTMTKTVDVDALTPPRNIGTAVATDALGQTVSATDDAVITVVLGAVLAQPELPRTGAPLRAQTWAALAMIQVGLVLNLAGRRRRVIRRAD